MNLRILENHPSVIAVAFFGSMARRDADDHSDRDIFVLCDTADLLGLQRMRHEVIIPAIGTHEGVCCYRLTDVILMARKGSLFLWHLKLQGRIILSKNRVYEGVLDALKPYNNYQEDLACYDELLTDVAESVSKHDVLSEFDLSILFTIARNVCILLCYHEGTPKFGRSNAYLTARRLFGKVFPLEDWVYPKLCSWKLWYERGVRPERSLSDEFPSQAVIQQVRGLLTFGTRQCICKTY